jgi:iron complex outermembrane recepter protein
VHIDLRVLLLPAILLTSAPPSTPLAEEPQLLEEIEVKARRDPGVETLEVREVRETPARDIGEALGSQGVTTKLRKGGIATDVVIRGQGRDNVSVTIDGAQLHGACPNRMDPPAFHIDYAEVDRVEVKKGPFDVTRPGGIGGTVDVKTRVPGDGLSAEVHAGAASAEALDASGTVSYGAEHVAGSVGAAYKQADPYRSGAGLRFTEIYAPTSMNRYRPDAFGSRAYEIGTGWAKLLLKPGAGHVVQVDYARQAADHVLYPYLKMDAVFDDTNRVNAGWDVPAFGPVARARVQAYASFVKHDMTDSLRCSSAQNPAACTGTLANGWSMDTYATSDVAGGSLEATVASWGETTFGVDFYQRTWDSSTTRFNRTTSGYGTVASIPDVRIDDVGLRLGHVAGVGQDLRLTFGARIDLATSKPRVDMSALYATYYAGLPASLTRDDVLVSGYLQAEYRPVEAVTVTAGYGHGERLPDPQERFFALPGSVQGTTVNPGTVGNPVLRKARNDEIDVGARWANGPVLLRGQAFVGLVSDFITILDIPSISGPAIPAKSWDNIEAFLWGGEAQARLALPASLYASATLSYTHGDDRTNHQPLLEVAPLAVAGSLRWDNGTFFVELEERWSARQDRVATSLQEAPTAAWYVTNAKLGVQARGFKVFAGVQNILDKDYVEHLSYLRDPFASGVKVPEPGRTVYANAQYVY